MGFPIGGLLAIANGALQGVDGNRQRAEQRARYEREEARRTRAEQLEELQAAARLGSTPGVRFGAPAASVAPVIAAGTAALGGSTAAPDEHEEDELHPAPHVGARTGPPGNGVGMAPGGASAGGGTGGGGGSGTNGMGLAAMSRPPQQRQHDQPAAGSTPVPAHISPVLASVGAGAPTTGAQRLGRVAGQDVYFDPTQTEAGQRDATRARGRTAYDALHAAHPDEYGAYDEGEDYVAHAREEAQHERLRAAFASATTADGKRRFTDQEAEDRASWYAHLGSYAPVIARALDTPRVDPNSEQGVAARLRVKAAPSGARAGGGSSGGGRGGRTSPTLEATRTDKRLDAIAERAIAAAGGDVQKAAQLLVNQRETQDVFTQGLNSTHLQAAAQRYQQRAQRASGGGRNKEGVADLVARLTQERNQKRAAYDRAAAAMRAQGKKDRDIAATLGERP